MAYTPTLEQVLSLGERFEALVEPYGFEEEREQVASLSKALADRPFRIVVVGEIKKGKSTLINTLVGQGALSPVATDVATSTVFRMAHGPEKKIVVHFEADEEGQDREPIEITAEELDDYGTEDGNPGNDKGVDHIRYEVPSDFLAKGFEVVDTPGLGALFKKHAGVTWKHVPTADAVVFVLDSKESVMTRDEAAYLERLDKLEMPVFFVQTKTDLADAEMVKGWAERNKSIIAETLGKPVEKLRYFPISSKLKQVAERRNSERHLKRSGYPRFERFVERNMLGALHAREGKKILAEMIRTLKRMRQELIDAKKANGGLSPAALKAEEAEIRGAQRELKAWASGEMRDKQRDLKNQLSDLRRSILRQLKADMDPSPNGVMIKSMTPFIEAACKDMARLNDHAAELVQTAQDACAQATAANMRHYKNQIGALLEQTAQSLEMASGDVELEGDDSALDDMASDEDVEIELSEASNTENLIRSALSAKMAILTGMAIPGVGWIVGPVGAIYLFHRSRVQFKARREAEADRKLKQLLAITIKESLKGVMEAFEDRAIAVDRGADAMFREAHNQRKEALEHRLQQVQDAKTGSPDDLKARNAKLKASFDALKALQQDILVAVGRGKKKAAAPS